ncbi:MAG TPA: hypothetical protein VMT17_16135 [Anaeromyxobacteraceae bacterium]|nr:hypothetical protein [Anaeromyxobacteraceae bacterium]
MRHSGRVLRPPGLFPAGLFPDLWGFGASRDLPPVSPPPRHRPHLSRVPTPRRDLVDEILQRIGRLFS